MAITKNILIKVEYMTSLNVSVGKVITQPLHIERAYIKVLQISGDKSNVHFEVGVYETEDKNNLVFTKNYNFIPSVQPGSENFIQQAYEYLKTLPEYADAIDILEEGQTL